MKLQENYRNFQFTVEEFVNNIKELQKKITEGKTEEKDIESHIEALRKKRDNVSSVI